MLLDFLFKTVISFLSQDACGRTTLGVAVLEGLLKMAKVLLFTPSSYVQTRQASGTTKTSGNRKSAAFLSPLAGANPLLADDEGRCPLHIAAWQGQVDLVYLLLQASHDDTR